MDTFNKSTIETNKNRVTLHGYGNTFNVSNKSITSTDADTFKIKSNNFSGTVRLYGADAPELSVYDKYRAITPTERAEAKKHHEELIKKGDRDARRSPVEYITQDFGNEARAASDKFINSSKNLELEYFGTDAYGRTLGSLSNDKGEKLNDYLIKEGLALTELPSSEFFKGSLDDYKKYNLMVEAYQAKKGIFSKDDFVNPSDFRKGKITEFKKRLDTQIRMEAYKEKGLGNNQYAYILADEDTYFTLPASLGASAHYGASLESNLMKQAGYNNMSSVIPYKGLAESLMEYNNEMLDNKPLSNWERFAARAYDTGLSAGGIGNWLNRTVFMPMGWGRVYKDEKGALPSIAGLAGKILDESYLYYANMNPDWATLGRDYKTGLGYSSMEAQSGIFQTMFEDTTAFVLAASQSLGMYVAITQPMEMIGASITKSFLDRSIQGTILDNTGVNGAALTKNRAFNHVFMAEYYFGDLAQSAVKPGGLAAAVLQQKIEGDNLRAPEFFNHNEGAGTAFKAQLMIGRDRARLIMEGTFKPFLMDVINPFNESAPGSFTNPNSPTGARTMNSYDKFNLAVDRLIKAVAAPVDLEIKFKAYQSVEFGGVEIELSDISDETKIAYAKANKGGVHIKLADLKPVSDFTGLSTEYNKYNSKLNKQLIDNNEELYKILTDKNGANLSDEAAKNFIFRSGTRANELGKIPATQQAHAQVLLQRKAQIGQAKNQLSQQMGAYADKIEINTTNTGTKYKKNIAAALQEILDMTPLNPLKWGLFSNSAEHADEFLQVGQLFSFKDAAEYTERILTGNNSLTAVFKQFEPVTSDPFEPGMRLAIDENLSNKVLARMTSVDRIIGQVWKNIKSIWSPEPKTGPNIQQLTKELRQHEIAVAKAAEKAKVEGFRFNVIEDTLDAARASVDVIVGNVDESIDLLDSVIEYSHSVRKDGAKVISMTDMSKAIDSAGVKDITGKLMRDSNRFSGNIKAEKFMEGTKGWIAAAVFAGLALNNIMQSTKGTSIVTQLGFALYGENEDLAVKYEANRILPLEALTVALNDAGLNVNQTAMNLVVDTVFIGGALSVGRKIAKAMTTTGYLPYTFDVETVQKMAYQDDIEIVTKIQGQIVDNSLIANMGAGHDNFVHIKKTVLNKDGTSVIKETVLTRTSAGFKSEKILQELAEEVPTKTLLFGSIAILATNALRQMAATTLSAMSESPDDKNYLVTMGILTGAGFAFGAGQDKMYQARAIEQSTEIARAGGKIATQEGVKRLLHTRGAKWAIGGAIVGATIWAAKLALDPNIKQKGSLDPLIAGVALGVGVGIFKHSASLGLAAGLVAMATMSALNWAGIRVLELGRGGKEIDAEKAKLVSQLASFSTAVLENEKSHTAFNVGIAAYASQFGSTKDILSNAGVASDETQVIAKQSPIPVLQFFVAEKIKGKRGELYGRTSPDSETTMRQYSLGIQSGALLGTSISVSLPVAYTPGRGFFGFSYDSDNNLMSVPNFAVKVGVWAALATASVGITFNLGKFISEQAYNMTGMQMFKENAENFGRAAGDLFSASRFAINAAEKITSFFIRQSVGIFTTLHGVDASLAFQTYKNSVSKTARAQDMLSSMSVQELSTMLPDEAAQVNTLDNIDGVKNAWQDIKAGSVLKYAERSKHLAIGALIGAVAGGMVSDLVKHFKLQSSMEGNASFDTLQQIEDQEERRKTIYIAIGGSAGAIGNDFIRGSNSLIKTLKSHHPTAVAEFLKSKNATLGRLYEGTERLVSKFGYSMPNNKYASKVLNSKISKFVFKASKLLSKNKHVGIFVAATLFSYIKTDGEFGIAQMMDRHIVYDDKSNAYKDYDQQTKKNLLHHLGTSAILGLTTTAIASISISPGRNQRETILAYAKRELDNINGGIPKTASLLSKVKHHAGNILFAASRYTADKESNTLLKSLLKVDNEFAEYEQWLEATKTNPSTPLPKKLEKVEDILKLRHTLGKEELKEYIALRNRKNSGMPLDLEEQKKVKDFLTKTKDTLSQVDANGIPKLKNLGRGFKATSNLTSFSKRATMFVAIAYATKLVITTVGNQGGEVGKDSYLDRLYNKANQVGKIGQRRQDGSLVGLEGTISMVADAARMITGRDVVNLNYAVDSLNGKMVKSTGQRLVSNAQGVAELQKTVKDLSEMLIIDNPNAYLATLSFGGKTLRNGEKGVTTSSYFQLQGPAQDISTATYSMSAKFIFKEYSSGKGKLGSVLDKGMAKFKANDSTTWKSAAVAIRNASSMMDALKNGRQYSRQGMETAATMAGDSLASLIIASRQEALAHIAWQPVDSLFTNMFFETVDKAKHRMGEEKLVKFLEGIARNDKSVLDVFANLMEGGLFESFLSKSAITNVIFFSNSFGKPPKQGNAQFAAADITALWHQSHDLSVQAEMFKQSRVELIDHVMDKIAIPLSSSGIFGLMPEWMKVGGLAITTVLLSAFVTMQIATFTDTKNFNQSSSELLDVFGRAEDTVGPKMVAYPNNIQKIRKELNKNIAEGQKYRWAEGSTGALQSPIVKGVAGNESKYIGLLNIGQEGKALHVRFEINPYFDILNDADTNIFIKTLEQKGDNLRNLFEYVETTLDENGKVIASARKTIAKALLDKNEVLNWMKAKNIDSVYDIFKGTGASTVTKTEFIGHAVDNFKGKFEQGLTKLYDLGNINKMDHHLFAVVQVNGQDVLVGELLDPDFKTDGLQNADDFGPATSLEARKQALRTRLEGQKQAFLNEVQEIVQDEYNKIKIEGRAANIADDTAQIAEANRRALIAIKTKLGDPSSAIGAVARGAGLIQATDLADQQATIDKVEGKNNPKQAYKRVTKKVISGNPVSEFTDDLWDTLQYQRPGGNIGAFDMLAGGGKGLMIAGFTMFDIVTGLDVLGAYLRVAEIQDNPFATNLDKKMANKELGRAIMSSAIGLTIGILGNKLLMGLGKLGLSKPKNLAKAGIALLGTALVGSVAWKSLIQPGINKLSGVASDKTGIIKGGFDKLWFTAGDFIGDVAAAPVIGAYNFGKHFGVAKEAGYFTAGFLGGGIATSMVMLGAGALLGTGLAISLPVFAAVAGGIGLVTGIAAIFGGKRLTSGMTYVTRETMKLPVIGDKLGITDPYRAIRNQERFKHNYADSPFLLGYVGDLVNTNWLQMLSAAENPGGRDTVALLFGEVLGQGEEYGTNISAWKLNAAESSIGGPPPIIDDVIQNELRIRAEGYADAVIGRYSWDQVVESSDNSRAIRGMEAQKRAERVKILEQARARAVKASLDVGGAQAALKTNNPRKNAVTQQQIANVDKVLTDLNTYGQPTVQVSAATLTTHKSNATNSNQELVDSAKGQALSIGGAGTAPNTKAHVYTTRAYVDNKIAVLDIEKKVDPMNVIYQQQAQTVGATESPSPEMQMQLAAYNASKDQK